MDTDLRDLLSAWLGGEGELLEAARLDELSARVRQDEGFRRAFLEEIRLLGMLRTVQAAEPRWLLLEEELGWSRHEPAASADDLLEQQVVMRICADAAPTWRFTRALIVRCSSFVRRDIAETSARRSARSRSRRS